MVTTAVHDFNLVELVAHWQYNITQCLDNIDAGNLFYCVLFKTAHIVIITDGVSFCWIRNTAQLFVK